MDKITLKNKLAQEGIFLEDSQLEKIIHLLESFPHGAREGQQEQVQQLQDELYYLQLEKIKYQNLCNERFQDRNNQTIAYQVGRLTLDFFSNPIKNFKPKEALEIYNQFLQRKKKKTGLTHLEKKLSVWIGGDKLSQINTAKSLHESDHQGLNLNTKIEESTQKANKETMQSTRPPLKRNLSYKKAKELKVAIILDEFSFNSFKDEFVPLILTPSNWKMVLAQQKPDLFFCESAWSGTDSVNRPWKGRVYASVNFPKENRTELLQILDYCNKNGIPTVFWNKEDPTHYPDRVHDFVKTAQLFDFVFTTAEECVEKYKQEYGLKHVYALPFATNPRVFNPIAESDAERTENIVFAGSWYANHVERSKTMHKLFDAFLSNGYELEFYNRYYGDGDPNHLIPEEYLKYEKPSVPNKEIGRVYKSSIFGLNMNTVMDSETMFARRVFELMSSNTLVLSNYSKGMDKMFGKNVIFLDMEPQRLKTLSKDEINRIREENLNNVLKNHTYQKRFETILDNVGIIYDKEMEKITLVTKVGNRSELLSEIELFRKDFSNESYRLLLILTKEFSDLEVAELYSEFNYRAINVVAESYIERYSNDSSRYIETPYFILANKLNEINQKQIGRALLHSSYVDNDYISLESHGDKKYTFEPVMKMSNIFAPKNKFTEAIASFNQTIQQRIYYI